MTNNISNGGLPNKVFSHFIMIFKNKASFKLIFTLNIASKDTLKYCSWSFIVELIGPWNNSYILIYYYFTVIKFMGSQ